MTPEELRQKLARDYGGDSPEYDCLVTIFQRQLNQCRATTTVQCEKSAGHVNNPDDLWHGSQTEKCDHEWE